MRNKGVQRIDIAGVNKRNIIKMQVEEIYAMYYSGLRNYGKGH